MSAKSFAFFGGLLMFVLGLVSLIPGLEGKTSELPPLKIELSYGRFLGLFPMNIMNKIALLLFGGAGIITGRITDTAYSIHYSRFLFFSWGLLAVLGVYAPTNTLNGIWPLFGGDIILHGLVAVFGGIAGFTPSHTTKQKISF